MVLAESIPVLNDWLQYGALGLCAILVVIAQINMTRMARALDRKDERANAVAMNAVKFISRCCDLLDRRPCLRGFVKGKSGLDDEDGDFSETGR
jgi:hypothetical protein